MSLVDPLLWRSELPSPGTPGLDLWVKIKSLGTAQFFLNYLIPVLAIIIILAILKWRYDRKRRLYATYVPAPFQPEPYSNGDEYY